MQDFLADYKDATALVNELQAHGNPVTWKHFPSYAHMDFLLSTDAEATEFPFILKQLLANSS